GVSLKCSRLSSLLKYPCGATGNRLDSLLYLIALQARCPSSVDQAARSAILSPTKQRGRNYGRGARPHSPSCRHQSFHRSLRRFQRVWFVFPDLRSSVRPFLSGSDMCACNHGRSLSRLRSLRCDTRERRSGAVLRTRHLPKTLPTKTPTVGWLSRSADPDRSGQVPDR